MIKKRIVCGVGINDIEKLRATNIAYIKWRGVIERCYDEKIHIKRPTYIGCSVCEEWHKLSNFKKWFDEHYIEGYHLDKDILFKGNKIYSPKTCCFVPPEINTFITTNVSRRGLQPIGVRYSKVNKKYAAQIERYNKKDGLGYFSTPEEAFLAYKQAKEAYIKEVANKWKDRIAQNVYDALMKYEVEITD